MPPHSSYYDGNYEVIHTVKPGESLSAIAQKYKFQGWQPIWVYNTQKDHLMLNPKGSPDSLAAGQHLFIPRSKDGYDKLLKKLEVLKMGLIASGESQKYQLEGIENEYKAKAVLFDFAGDVATLMGSLAVKAVEVTKLRNATVGLEGAQRFAAEIQLKKGMEDLAEAMGAKKLALTAVDGAVGWQANKLDDDDKADYIKKGSTFATSTTPKLITAVPDYLSKRKLGPALRQVAGGLHPFLDFADMALDYIKVSTLADAYLKMTTGETVDDSLKNSKAAVDASIAKGLVNLHERILRIQKERDLLYHPASAPAGGPSTKLP